MRLWELNNAGPHISKMVINCYNFNAAKFECGIFVVEIVKYAAIIRPNLENLVDVSSYSQTSTYNEFFNLFSKNGVVYFIKRML